VQRYTRTTQVKKQHTGNDEVVDHEPAEYLADASMRDAELPGDVTRTYTVSRHLHDPLTNHIRQRASVDEHSSQLVDPSMTWIRSQCSL